MTGAGAGEHRLTYAQGDGSCNGRGARDGEAGADERAQDRPRHPQLPHHGGLRRAHEPGGPPATRWTRIPTTWPGDVDSAPSLTDSTVPPSSAAVLASNATSGTARGARPGVCGATAVARVTAARYRGHLAP